MSSVSCWLIIGFLGQTLFTARFVVQWFASERRRDSIVPVAFWWLSLSGGAALLAYATFRRDPVIIAGQGMGLAVYIRNLMLIYQGQNGQSPTTSRARVTYSSRTLASGSPEAGS
jgi:lipid-A-disaccharide synthase-like uncharacterized protein